MNKTTTYWVFNRAMLEQALQEHKVTKSEEAAIRVFLESPAADRAKMIQRQEIES